MTHTALKSCIQKQKRLKSTEIIFLFVICSILVILPYIFNQIYEYKQLLTILKGFSRAVKFTMKILCDEYMQKQAVKILSF